VKETFVGGGSTNHAIAGSSGTAPIGANVDFIQVEFQNAVAAEEITGLEVRLTDASGDLFFNDDLINKYKSPNSDWQYAGAFGIEQAGASTDIMPFGDTGYEFLDMEIDLPTMAADRAGIVFGYQNANNYYEVYLDSTDTLTVRKIVAGVPVAIDTAPTFDGGASTIDVSANAYKLRVLRNLTATTPIATPADTFRAIQVFIDDILVENSDWVTESGASSNDYLVDTSFATGLLGLISEGSKVLDNLSVHHLGLFIRDANLTLDTGAQITVQPGGLVDMMDVVVNVSQTLLVNLGGTVILNNVTWADTDFDESIDGVVTLECARVQVTEDVILSPAGQLNMIGCIMEFSPLSDFAFRIITDASLVEPPIDLVATRLFGVIPRLRALDGSDAPYELDQSFEVILSGPEDIHPIDFSSNPVHGLDSHRNTTTGHGDREVTIAFFTNDDMCLFGKFCKYRDNETPIEFIYARGVLHDVRVINVNPLFVPNENIRQVRFSVELSGGFLD
jgi:hypothetical protein